jgi:Protein of unknown function (DUF1703).
MDWKQKWKKCENGMTDTGLARVRFIIHGAYSIMLVLPGRSGYGTTAILVKYILEQYYKRTGRRGRFCHETRNRRTYCRKSGEGRPDLLLKTPSVRGTAVILEIKTADTFSQMEEQYIHALEQIENRHYEAELLSEGYSDIKNMVSVFIARNVR